MAKSKRKPSTAQRSKVTIEHAKYLKKHGFISSKANLHSGRFVSPGVLRKVREYEFAVEQKLVAVKVPRKTREAAKSEGYLMVGSKVIAPNDRKFINRLKSGITSGIQPVPGGAMYKVALPVDITDLPAFFAFVNSGALDSYKLPGEEFAFSFHGHQSYRAYGDTQEFLDDFKKYETVIRAFGPGHVNSLTTEYRGLELYRLQAGDYYPLTMKQRREGARQRAKERRAALTSQDRRGKPYKEPSVARKRYDAKKKRNQRTRLKEAGGADYVAFLLKERERVRKAREKARKG